MAVSAETVFEYVQELEKRVAALESSLAIALRWFVYIDQDQARE